MGFFSKLLGTVAGVAGRFLGVPAVGAVRQAVVAPAARALAAGGAAGRVLARSRVGRGALALGGAAALGGAFAGGEALAAGAIDDDGVGIVGGNGLTVRRTIVQTINRQTGEVVRARVLRGAPFIMRHDIIVAKRVIRMASKLGRTKGLRHTVKQSVASQLTEAIRDQALDAVRALGGSSHKKEA